MKKNELLNEEVSNKAYLKTRASLNKEYRREGFTKNAFIGFDNEFSKKESEIISEASKASGIDKQEIRRRYNEYVALRKEFDSLLSEKNKITNRTDYTDRAKVVIKTLKKNSKEVSKAVAALNKGRDALKKSSDKEYDLRKKDAARAAKYRKSLEKKKPAMRKFQRDSEIRYADKKKRQDFINRVKSKVAKINFVSGK